jgi:integrase
VLALLYGTGLRRGELTRLNLDDLVQSWGEEAFPSRRIVRHIGAQSAQVGPKR